MGCVQSMDDNHNNSNSLHHQSQSPSKKHLWCLSTHQETTNQTSSNYLLQNSSTMNDMEVDLSHFSKPKDLLGIGGFGLVRKITKLTGNDNGTIYAIKSINKGMILSRQSGPTAVMTELKTLILLESCDLVCRLHYAFQDKEQLYMILVSSSFSFLIFIRFLACASLPRFLPIGLCKCR
jgi:hypothetical protein